MRRGNQGHRQRKKRKARTTKATDARQLHRGSPHNPSLRRFNGGFMNRMRTVLALLGLLVAVSSAQAQQPRVKADIPFPFVVGNRILPAGEYLLSRESSFNRVIAIRPADGKGGMLSQTDTCESSKPSDKTKLVFHTLGGRYFLSEIWVEGNDRGVQLPKSKAEIEMAKNNDEAGEFVLAANVAR
jgi:hypothetical protein